jgi:hypothetical protein
MDLLFQLFRLTSNRNGWQHTSHKKNIIKGEHSSENLVKPLLIELDYIVKYK